MEDDLQAFALKAFLDMHQTVMKLNLDRRTLSFLKRNGVITDAKEEYDSEKIIEEFIGSGTIFPDDVFKFDVFLNAIKLKEKFSQKESGALFAFRRFGKNHELKWSRIVMSVPQEYHQGEPTILLSLRDLPFYEANYEESINTYIRKVIKIVKHNHDKNESSVIFSRPSEYFTKREQRIRHLLEGTLEYEAALIHPDDLKIFNHFSDLNVIEEYFKFSHEEMACYYRRRNGNLYKWVRLLISRSADYTAQNRTYIYIIEDIHDDLINLFDQQGLSQFNLSMDNSDSSSDIYHANLLRILTYMTEKYIDFYMIDLEHDMYVMYKIKPEAVNGDFPYIGSYSEISTYYVNSLLSKDQRQKLIKQTDCESLRKRLKNRSTVEFIFRHVNGQKVKTTCTKIESKNGIPTKAICCTVPFAGDDLIKVKTFGNFEAFDREGKPLKFKRRQSKQLFAYLIDKQGFPVATKDIINDILEKEFADLNGAKYVSTIAKSLIQDLDDAGYEDIIVREWNTLRVRPERIDCDYYHLMGGDSKYWAYYHNEYMKEYSWAEETNSEILELAEE